MTTGAVLGLGLEAVRRLTRTTDDSTTAGVCRPENAFAPKDAVPGTAAEAQAIDRAHRIGQARPVIAYRLIARDTVEEKVLELQDTTRDLAKAIIASDALLFSGTSQRTT